MDSKKFLVIHPFAFAIFPVLFLYSHNVNEALLRWTVVPSAIILFCALLLFVVLSYLCKNKDKAGLLVSLLLVFFFAYGHFAGTFRGLANGWKEVHLLLLPIWTVCFIVPFWLVLRTGMRLINMTKILNVMAICLALFSLVNIVRFEIRSSILREGADAVLAEEFSSVSKKPGDCPNIYYIILDAYVGNDVLKESLDYDNSLFLEQLAQRGFFVAGQSRSNYWKTLLSLPSSMNFEYLDGLANRIGIESGDKKPLREHLVNNRVFSFLKRYGYSTVAFASGFRWSELRDADAYMSAGVWALNDFSGELVYNTPIAALVELFANRPFKHILQRRRVLYSFEHLTDTVEIESPFFVFAHIACPHKPFVFDEDGGPVGSVKSPEDFSEMYIQQLKYVNKRVIGLVDELLANSVNPPIIVLQADHGIRWGLNRDKPENNTPQIYKECFSILNAYYLPDCDYSQFYDSISPVNTFRVIFNHYFETEFELLKDESYFSTRTQSYNFINVTAELNQ
ncbi:MAG: hypothetical protein ACYTFK_07760 [Planctomycetota bacterium]|jgi:hypothetical protein